MNDVIDLDELQRLYDAATRGEWQTDRSARWIIRPDSDSPAVLQAIWNETVQDNGGLQASANGKFVAAAHNAMPALLSEIAELRRRTEQAEAKALCFEGGIAALGHLNGILTKERDTARRWAAKWKHVAKAFRPIVAGYVHMKEMYLRANERVAVAEAALAAAMARVEQLETVNRGYHHTIAMMLYQNGPCRLSYKTRVGAPLNVEICVKEDPATPEHVIQIQGVASERTGEGEQV